MKASETLTDVNGIVAIGEPKPRASVRSITLPFCLASEIEQHLSDFPSSLEGLTFTASKPRRSPPVPHTLGSANLTHFWIARSAGPNCYRWGTRMAHRTPEEYHPSG